jgi:hypothetical protein
MCGLSRLPSMEACTEILSSWKRLTDRAIADGRYQAAIRDTAGKGACVESVARFRKFNIDSKFSPVLELQHV